MAVVDENDEEDEVAPEGSDATAVEEQQEESSSITSVTSVDTPNTTFTPVATSSDQKGLSPESEISEQDTVPSPSAPPLDEAPPPPPALEGVEEPGVAVQQQPLVVQEPPVEPEPDSSDEEEAEDRCKFHRNKYIGISGEDCLELHAPEPWPEDVKLYQPDEDDQILLTDYAHCLAVQAFLKMCRLTYEVEPRHNAEFMSPSGEVPFIQCGAFVVSELNPIVGFVSAKGVGLSDKMDPTQKAEMQKYMSLVTTVLENASLYVTWVHSTTLREVTKPRHGSVYPWPLNHLVNWQKSCQVKGKLATLGWYWKSINEVFADVEDCCNTLTEKLENKEYFFGSPTELDCMVYGYLFSILTTSLPLPENRLANIIREHGSLMQLVKRIDSTYFNRTTRVSFDETAEAREAAAAAAREAQAAREAAAAAVREAKEAREAAAREAKEAREAAAREAQEARAAAAREAQANASPPPADIEDETPPPPPPADDDAMSEGAAESEPPLEVETLTEIEPPPEVEPEPEEEPQPKDATNKTGTDMDEMD